MAIGGIVATITRTSPEHHQTLMSETGAFGKLRSLEDKADAHGLIRRTSAQVEKVFTG
jgi:hypothetical protein